MKHLITTLILLIATAVVTVVYFKNLSPPGRRPVEVMQHIPEDASLIAEFSNDEGFYEAFSGNHLLTAIAGPDKTTELDALRKYLLNNTALKPYFNNQPIYVSIHPSVANQVDFLLTTSVDKDFKGSILSQLKNTAGDSVIIEPIKKGDKQLYQINITGLKRPFFLAEIEHQIFTGSFSDELISKSINYDFKQHKHTFLQLSEQQHNNAMAILYVNYTQLQPLFQQMFENSNPDLFRAFRIIPAQAALSLNYKTDALMLNGLTELEPNKPISYLNLFTSQKPVENHLKEIFPSTTAYSTSFSVSNPVKFIKDLAAWNNKSGSKEKQQALFKQIKTETGVNIDKEFNSVLGAEFAVVTTRFEEKLAIIEVSNGQQLFPSMMNISNAVSDNIGQFKYSRIPFYLLGDAFGIFNKPYFMIINNYLILANTPSELRAYADSYNNQKFLNKTESFNDFDDMLSERSNVAFFINFKNMKQVFKRDLKPGFNDAFQHNDPGFKNYYAASYQLIASDNNYYTNFCMKLAKVDSTKTER
ncbi:hypothetical protein [Mucilaginibacter polytrichastri]|uniref:DUF3352 domain-containing protein n=1 Tax=Mucilaginibacter polytrichastri TaxID=1302689 RepID=A0A1Q5ZZQ3_9SPHI|nr:hypothetical protein [Mucilaginibacter polytrichastri]OKS87226.1 hypothetical protein RG47T_2685 [Mucilaginibacter polytrichastri]SFT18942.1 hypothetical protein SAMN04487890_11574 [Mucilaginibacter polytrichastri]